MQKASIMPVPLLQTDDLFGLLWNTQNICNGADLITSQLAGIVSSSA